MKLALKLSHEEVAELRTPLVVEMWNKRRDGRVKRAVMKIKRAKTIKEYPTKCYGYTVTVPVGSTVSNSTACGPDDNYRFWQDFHKVAAEVSGFKDSLLRHDLTYYGLNIPAEYCEPYPED